MDQLQLAVKSAITLNLASVPIGISGLRELISEKAEELRSCMGATTELTNAELAIEVAQATCTKFLEEQKQQRERQQREREQQQQRERAARSGGSSSRAGGSSFRTGGSTGGASSRPQSGAPRKDQGGA